jgi:hypothetical protein
VIAKGANEARMIISAPLSAPIGLLSPKIVGTARIGDKDVVREAAASEDLMQAFYYMHNVPTREMLLAILERGPFTLTLDLPPREVLKVPRSGRVEVAVKVRGGGETFRTATERSKPECAGKEPIKELLRRASLVGVPEVAVADSPT